MRSVSEAVMAAGSAVIPASQGRLVALPIAAMVGQRDLHQCLTDVDNGGFPVRHSKESLLFEDAYLDRRKPTCFFS